MFLSLFITKAYKTWNLQTTKKPRNSKLHTAVQHQQQNVNSDPFNECDLLCCGGHVAGVFRPRGKGHCESIQSNSEWSPLSYDKTFLSQRECSLPTQQCFHLKGLRGVGVTEWVWRCMNHVLWTSQSPVQQWNTYVKTCHWYLDAFAEKKRSLCASYKEAL